MKHLYNRKMPTISFMTSSSKLLLLGSLILGLSGLFIVFDYVVETLLIQVGKRIPALIRIKLYVNMISKIFAILGILSIILSIICLVLRKDENRIKHMISKALFYKPYGNPLHFKDGEILPIVKCRRIGNERYELVFNTGASSIEKLGKLSTTISSALNGKYEHYAVTNFSSDLACNTITFLLENVSIDKSICAQKTKDLKGNKSTLIPIQKGTCIDLETSGSILLSGKTRSGKTTAAISILISTLLWGSDKYKSTVTIVDPKRAELSRLSHVVTLDEDSTAHNILNAMREFEIVIKERQHYLNNLSEKTGDASKWWEAGMHVSFLFIDEFVSLRSLFPTSKTKDPNYSSDYNQQVFDNILKRIVTTGASAGCYCMISIAEASVQEGGLPAMLRSAMSTKILMKPTLSEARLMWDSAKLETVNTTRVYKAGDAWFSSTDGLNDDVNFVRFPVMEFEVYGELAKLLEQYYQ